MKDNTTKRDLFCAIDRIINKETFIIPSSRRLSIRAVEEEAGLGDGSAYYYEDVINKIKSIQNEAKKIDGNVLFNADVPMLKDKLRRETAIKEKYRLRFAEQGEKIKLMAKEHNELFQQMLMYKEKAESLDKDLSMEDKNLSNSS